jgi:hypothetical protein
MSHFADLPMVCVWARVVGSADRWRWFARWYWKPEFCSPL